MKPKALLAVLFVAGLAASLAIAAPADRGKRKGTTATATGTTGTTTGAQRRCHNVHLRGTASPSSFTMTVEKASRRARDLKTATLRFSGEVRVNAIMCSTGPAAQAATLDLRTLKVSKQKKDD